MWDIAGSESMKKKQKTGLTGFGIFIVVAAAIVMMWVKYNKNISEPLLTRILAGLLSCVTVLFGSGLIFLAFFVIFYGAIKLAEEVFTKNPEGDLMESFSNLENPIAILCFIASYIICLLEI